MKKRHIYLLLLIVACFPESLQAGDDFVTVQSQTLRIIDGVSEIPVDVTVDEFHIATTEVTQQEFMDMMGYNPSQHKGGDLPVESVSWREAAEFCNKRSEAEGLNICFDLDTGACDLTQNGYRLPTNAEWSLADSSIGTAGNETIRQFANIGSANTKSISELKRDLDTKNTVPVASLLPNALGIYDMAGNVWEWCCNYADPVRDSAYPPENPQGPSNGIERVIRGGSYMSLANSWSRGFRSSMKPDTKSRYTGFRVCRSGAEKVTPEALNDPDFFEPYNRIPDGFKGNTGELSSLLDVSGGDPVKTTGDWQRKRDSINQKWTKLLGKLPSNIPIPNAEMIREYKEEGYTGRLMYLDVEEDFSEKILVMIPDKPIRVPTPVVIVPYYDVDTPAGKNLGGRTFRPMGVRSFAYLMAREGYITISVRWFGESYGEHYGEAVANLKRRHPELSGLGKWIWDAQRLVDYIHTMPEADHDNIGIIGHSLGGKMALYAAAFDDRITAAVSSELGIGLGFSNYDDFWYFGDYIRDVDASTDHHELLGLIAPRSFLLIGGDEFDTDKSWHYINAARDVYDLYGKPRNIGYFNHRTGHSPTPESVRFALDWLKYFLSE